MRPAFRSIVAGLAVLGACGGDSLTGPSAIVGTYTLQSVSGQALPGLLDEGSGSRTDITGGRMILDADGTLHQETDISTSFTGGARTGGTLHSFGTYVHVANRVIVSWNDGRSDSMRLSGSTLTYVREGLTLEYRR